jgi:hypothetical protein
LNHVVDMGVDADVFVQHLGGLVGGEAKLRLCRENWDGHCHQQKDEPTHGAEGHGDSFPTNERKLTRFGRVAMCGGSHEKRRPSHQPNGFWIFDSLRN